MRVSVYQLREKGLRRPPAEVRASRPIEGFIRVTREPGGRVNQWARTSMLFADAAEQQVLLQLHQVQLQHWDSRGVVLAGIETRWSRKQRTDYRQSWFVVLKGEDRDSKSYMLRSAVGSLVVA